jgi:hypothetical protein
MTQMILRKLAPVVAVLALVLVPSSAHAASTYQVSPTGNDAAAGTAAAPLATLGQALVRAQGGDRIVLAAGSYPVATDNKARTADVTVVGAGTGRTFVKGLKVEGGQHLDVSRITFTDPVVIRGHAWYPSTIPGSDVDFHDNEVATTATCVTIKANAQRIRIAGNDLHGCSVGIAGPGQPLQSSDIDLVDNRITDSTSDGIQFGSWDDVRVDSNEIARVSDPAKSIHNDGIQLTGDSTHVTINANHIVDSRVQLIFIQDAIGAIDDVTVSNNLVVGSGGAAIQSLGATRARFVNNTAWNGAAGGVWSGKGSTRNGTNVMPADTVVANNIANTIKYLDNVRPAVATGNVMPCPAKYSGIVVPVGTSCLSNIAFADATSGAYWLQQSSQARTLGSAELATPDDLNQNPRVGGVPGAYR